MNCMCLCHPVRFLLLSLTFQLNSQQSLFSLPAANKSLCMKEFGKWVNDLKTTNTLSSGTAELVSYLKRLISFTRSRCLDITAASLHSIDKVPLLSYTILYHKTCSESVVFSPSRVKIISLVQPRLCRLVEESHRTVGSYFWWFMFRLVPKNISSFMFSVLFSHSWFPVCFLGNIIYK